MNKQLAVATYEQAGLPKKYWNYSFLDFVELPVNGRAYSDIVKKLKAYTENRLDTYGFGIMFTGPFRSGKTALSIAFAKYFMKQHNFMPMFVSNHRLYSAYFGNDSWSFSDLLLSKFIILDDIGREYKRKDFAGNVLEDLIRERINNDLGTLITTNLTPDELKDFYGTAFYSLLNEMFRLQVKMPEMRDNFTMISDNIYKKLGGIT